MFDTVLLIVLLEGQIQFCYNRFLYSFRNVTTHDWPAMLISDCLRRGKK